MKARIVKRPEGCYSVETLSWYWPFPTQLPPSKPGEPKFNPDNFEPAPW
jgi:hypothetical protein